jgi:hypothetical protein
MTREQMLSEKQTVFTRDGHALGTVRRTLGDYFQVLSDDSRERWFPLATLVPGKDRPTVDFEEADMLAASVPAPDDYDQSQYIEEDERTPEQEAQRRMVLGELAEQRRELRSEDGLPAADRTVGEPVEKELGESAD